ncbi:MAG: hypothetical protein HQK53_17660, partial [Oligoflexia bacterium]|nr:hypothetical protein [Oligoflexia bacterium]
KKERINNQEDKKVVTPQNATHNGSNNYPTNEFTENHASDYQYNNYDSSSESNTTSIQDSSSNYLQSCDENSDDYPRYRDYLRACAEKAGLYSAPIENTTQNESSDVDRSPSEVPSYSTENPAYSD